MHEDDAVARVGILAAAFILAMFGGIAIAMTFDAIAMAWR